MRYILFFCCLSLMSCYTAIPLTLYKDSYRDDSYKDREADEENEFSVVAKGNKITPMDRVSDYAVLRSAQLMDREGFKYFVVSKKIEDYSIGKELNTQAVHSYGYTTAKTDVVDVREPTVGLLVMGYNEKSELEDKDKNKVYKTDDVLKEFGHYVNERQPTEFNLYMTILGIGTTAILVWAFTL